MPVYEYSCGSCGEFAVSRPMAEYREPHDCPGCGASAPRVVATAPRLAGMASARRTAFETNERAANSPRQAAGHVHGPSCGCAGTRRSDGAKSFAGTRPWMISH